MEVMITLCIMIAIVYFLIKIHLLPEPEQPYVEVETWVHRMYNSWSQQKQASFDAQYPNWRRNTQKR